MVFSTKLKKLNIHTASDDKTAASLCLCTCGLRSHQGFAGCPVMQGDDLDGVLGPWTEASEQHAVLLPSGRRTQLSLALLRAGVEDAVGRHSAVRTVPSDAHGGVVDVGEDEVFWTVHSCRQVCSWRDLKETMKYQQQLRLNSATLSLEKILCMSMKIVTFASINN